MLSAARLTSRRRPADRATTRPRLGGSPLWTRVHHASASAAAAAAAAAAIAAVAETASPSSPPPSAPSAPSPLAALLAPRLPPLLLGQARLTAAVFWDADNVRPSGGDPPARAAAARVLLTDLARQLADAGCRVVHATAYGNAATLGGSDDPGSLGGGGDEEDQEDEDDEFRRCSRPRVVVTSTRKRQSADMALLSDLAAFVSSQQQQQQQQREQEQEKREPQPQQQQPLAPPIPPQPTPRPAVPSCLVLLIADDAGYGVTCAWASAPPRSAALVACGASAGRRARYAPPSSPAEPRRFHPLGRSGAAAAVVPWRDGGLDVAAAWIDPDGLLA